LQIAGLVKGQPLGLFLVVRGKAQEQCLRH
jgi:hypothetical protein